MRANLKKFLPFWIIQLLKIVRGSLKGTWPLRLSQIKLANSVDMESLTGKIRFKMAFDRNPLLTTFADKAYVRNYVAEKIGLEYLSNVIAILNNGQGLEEVKLPREFVLKSNNGSGAMILVTELAPKNALLPEKLGKQNWEKFLIHPDSFEADKANRLIDIWLKQNYYYRIGQYPEWAYKNIKPAVLIEEFMYDGEGNLPRDFKFFVIDGKCEYVQVDSARYQSHTRDMFTPSWRKIDGINVYPNSEFEIHKPEKLSEMLAIAEKLAESIDFVRVDLYQTSKGIKFGELTNYPGGGTEKFEPSSLDKTLGSRWKPRYSNIY